MDYKQHKGNLRGQIKNKVERKLYNKRMRSVGKTADTSDGQLTIPDVILSWWNFMNEDDQIWLMMKYGYDNSLSPKRVKREEIIKMYKLEHGS